MTSCGLSEPDVLVVGGGLIGLLIARELAREGARVEVVDDQQPGAASPAAAGMIAPVAESTTDDAYARLSIASRDLWQELVPELESESRMTIDHDASGSILPVLDAEGANVLEGIRKKALQLGESAETLDRAELDSLVPDLRDGIEQALLLPGEHRVDNRLATEAAAAALQSRRVPHHRARIEAVAEESSGVAASGSGFNRRAGAVIVCGGAWTPAIRGLPTLPISPVKGQMIGYDGVNWPFTGAIRTPSFYAVRRAGGRLLIGASVEHTGFDLSLTSEVGSDLAARAGAILPTLLDREPVEQWAGLRPGTPDGWPVVGRVGERLFVATGHFRNGILLAPLTARMIAPLVLGLAAPDSRFAIPQAMQPVRFTGPPA